MATQKCGGIRARDTATECQKATRLRKRENQSEEVILAPFNNAQRLLLYDYRATKAEGRKKQGRGAKENKAERRKHT